MIYHVYGKAALSDIDNEEPITSFSANDDKQAKQKFSQAGYASLDAVLFNDNYEIVRT
jgi:hypothetical protein